MGEASGSSPISAKALTFVSHYRVKSTGETIDAGSGPCIFVAEDNPGDVELLRVALQEHQVVCDLLVARDGEKALGFIAEIGDGSSGCPAVAILDLNLPKRNGREVLQHMRKCPAFQGIPIVVLSSSGSPKDMAEATELGATQYIRKPSSLDDFLQIGAVLKRLLAPDS